MKKKKTQDISAHLEIVCTCEAKDMNEAMDYQMYKNYMLLLLHSTCEINLP